MRVAGKWWRSMFFFLFLSLSLSIVGVWCFNVDWTIADSACVRLPRLLFPRPRIFKILRRVYVHVAGENTQVDKSSAKLRTWIGLFPFRGAGVIRSSKGPEVLFPGIMGDHTDNGTGDVAEILYFIVILIIRYIYVCIRLSSVQFSIFRWIREIVNNYKQNLNDI